MIAYLRGTLQQRDITGGPSDRLVIDVGGVGFELTVSRNTLLAAGEPGDDVTIHTSLSIRETEWVMFGFASRAECEMFSLLQSVSGVGPKLALALVGALGPTQVADAISAGDQKMLSQAPGVGSKVAQRIILELKTKIEDWQGRRGMTAGAPIAGSNSILEARTILEGLGYTATEISMAFKIMDKADDVEDVEVIVRQSLKLLGAAGR